MLDSGRGPPPERTSCERPMVVSSAECSNRERGVTSALLAALLLKA